MKTNLKVRTIVIVITLLVCVVGIIGFPKSAEDVKKNFSSNIRLGLDLKGGTQLVMQVQVQDAVKADLAQAGDRLKEDMKKQGVTWVSMDVNEVPRPEDAAKVALEIKGVPAAQASAVRSLVSDRYP